MHTATLPRAATDKTPPSALSCVALIVFFAGLLLITAPLWRLGIETKPLKISRIIPEHASKGNWVEIDGENFTRASRFFFDHPGAHVEARHVVFINSHKVFVQIP